MTAAPGIDPNSINADRIGGSISADRITVASLISCTVIAADDTEAAF